MKLTIKTKDIELEYQDEYSIIEESAKTRILTILDKVFEKQTILEASKPILNPYPTGIINTPFVGTVEEFFNDKKK